MSTYLEEVVDKLETTAKSGQDEGVTSILKKLEDLLKKGMKTIDLTPNMEKKEHLGQLLSLVDQVRSLERLLAANVFDTEALINRLYTLEKLINQLKDIPSPAPEKQAEEKQQRRSTLGLEEKFDKSNVLANMRRSYGDLQGTDVKVCLLSFSIFPDNSVIKKRPLIYWWIGEGFVASTREKTAEEIGEEIFEKLLRKDLIQPGEPNPVLPVKSCIMHPWVRRMLVSLAREARLFSFDSKWPMMPSDHESFRRSCLVNQEIPTPQDTPEHTPISPDNDEWKQKLLTVFNVNVQYLNLKQEWLEKLKRVEVLHLGRWQSSPDYHIEVDQKTFAGSHAVSFLNGLGGQKHLKYLSLRGVSRVSELPASIRSLISLEILDLRACYDLERLPSDISSLKKLTHLDISECYLLEGMPKGIHKLSSLQVLKGFRIGSTEKTPTKLSDLDKLKDLRRLSIHIGNEAAVQPGEFKKLKTLASLHRLKISWGLVSDTLEKEIDSFLFPPHLEKLDLQGLPLDHVRESLKPSKLKKLKKLYIRGGNLTGFKHMHEENEQWKVEILRLEFLKQLSIDTAEVENLFPHLKKYYCNVDTKAHMQSS